MLNKFERHAGYYISLIAILVLGFVLTSMNSSYRELQIGIVALTTIFYVLLGILHHLLNHDLSSKIVIEYVLIGSFGLAIIAFLLKGGLGL